MHSSASITIVLCLNNGLTPRKRSETFQKRQVRQRPTFLHLHRPLTCVGICCILIRCRLHLRVTVFDMLERHLDEPQLLLHQIRLLKPLNRPASRPTHCKVSSCKVTFLSQYVMIVIPVVILVMIMIMILITLVMVILELM